jgi:2-octaprenyl-6-methoxyphenol hydroxylase
MEESAFHIAILGAGPVGRALALMLARIAPDPSRIVLVQGGSASQPANPSAAALAPSSDARVLALNHGSRVLLASLNALPHHCADIRTIHVSQRGRLGRTLIEHGDFAVDQLGSVASYADVQEALAQQVARCGVTIRQAQGARVVSQDSSGAAVLGAEGFALRCAVAVVSDGAGADDVRREYGQHAVLTTVKAARPRTGWAFERFTSEGPLALLPHPSAADAYSVVWCCTPKRAAALAALDNAAFSQSLSQAFGDRLGTLTCLAPRHVFPLFMSVRRALVQGRSVAVGNAAQTLHPVAGQGLNLGLRDAARLAQALGPWLLQPARDPGAALSRFASARRGDRWITTALTDLMPRIFATGLAPIEHACGLALLGLDLAAPLRSPLARHLLQGLRD